MQNHRQMLYFIYRCYRLVFHKREHIRRDKAVTHLCSEDTHTAYSQPGI